MITLQRLNVVIRPADSDICDSTLVSKRNTDIMNRSSEFQFNSGTVAEKHSCWSTLKSDVITSANLWLLGKKFRHNRGSNLGLCHGLSLSSWVVQYKPWFLSGIYFAWKMKLTTRTCYVSVAFSLIRCSSTKCNCCPSWTHSTHW